MRPITLRPADHAPNSQAFLHNLRTKRSTNPTQLPQTDFRSTGKPRSRTRTAKNTTRRKSSEGSAFWKNLSRRYYGVRRLPDNFFLPAMLAVELVSGAGEGIRTPDPLITNQMLYRLSYASNWGKARLRANLSHGSLPDVRDNYIKYHRCNFRCNKRLWPRELTPKVALPKPLVCP